MQAWDVRQSAKALRKVPGMSKVPLWMQADGRSAGIALYASLFEENVHRLYLHNLVKSHFEGPHFINVLKHLDLPEAVALAAVRSQVRIYQDHKDGWQFPAAVSEKLGWDRKQFKVVVLDKGR